MIKRKNKRFILLMLFGIIVISFFIIMTQSISVFAYNNHINYARHIPTLDDDFAGNKVIVTLKPGYSDVNKKVELQNFCTTRVMTAQHADLESSSVNINDYSIASDKIIIKSIKDLTYMSNPAAIKKRESFTQILSIDLEDNNKEKVLKLIKELEQIDMVLAAEPDYNISTEDLWITPPNDSLYNEQWGLKAAPGIRAEEAWALMAEEISPRIKVGIFEQGIRDHEDLLITQGNKTGEVQSEHGTQVGGIIGAIRNNNKGIAGIAPVELALLARDTNMDSGNSEIFSQSLIWAIDNNIKIINCSFRFMLGPDQMREPIIAHKEAIRIFGENGGLLIAAAGNLGENTDYEFQFPSSYGDARYFPEINNVITVGAIDSTGERAKFEHNDSSNYGQNSVHIYAPGKDITSTEFWSSYKNNCLGTSIAAPHVTGVAALLRSINPDLTPAQLIDVILESAAAITITIPNGGKHNARRLDAFEAVKRVSFMTNQAGDTIIGVRQAVNLSGEIIIPAQINGIPITTIGNGNTPVFATGNAPTIITFATDTQVSTIAASAFSGLTSLSQILIPASVTSISEEAFINTSKLSNITVDINNEHYASQNGILYNKLKNKIIHIPKLISGKIIIPENITFIPENAFKNCINITSISFPNNLIEIGDSALENCNKIQSIVIPNSVESIGYRAFANCFDLGMIIFEGQTNLNMNIFGTNYNKYIIVPCSDKQYYEQALANYDITNLICDCSFLMRVDNYTIVEHGLAHLPYTNFSGKVVCGFITPGEEIEIINAKDSKISTNVLNINNGNNNYSKAGETAKILTDKMNYYLNGNTFLLKRECNKLQKTDEFSAEIEVNVVSSTISQGDNVSIAFDNININGIIASITITVIKTKVNISLRIILETEIYLKKGQEFTFNATIRINGGPNPTYQNISVPGLITSIKSNSIIKPEDYGFEQQYYFEEKEKNILADNNSIYTKRLRTGYIQKEYIVLSPRRAEAGIAYLEYCLLQPATSINVDLALWSASELLRSSDCTAVFQYKDFDGNWITKLDLLNDIILTTDRSNPINYTIIFENPVTEFRFYLTSPAIGASSNTGRLCIGDMKIYFDEGLNSLF